MTPHRLRSLALALAFAPSALAQDATPTTSLSLQDAVERARAASPRLAQTRSLSEASRASVRAAQASRLPQLDALVGYTRSSHVPELQITAPGLGTRTLFPDLPDAYRARAQVAVPLYTGGRLSASVASAQEQHRAAALDTATAENDLVLETTTAYLSLVMARESDRVLREALLAYEAHLQDARNRLDLGMAARNEVLAVQVERERAELARLQAENAAWVANANLVRLTDLPPGSAVDPTDSFDAPPGEPEAAPEALVAAALEARPDLSALRARSRAAEAGVRAARGAYFPQASFLAGYDYANPNSRVLPLEARWQGTWSLGVNVAWTPFDSGRTSAAVAQARAQADALTHLTQDLERRVRLDVGARLADLATARAAVGVAERGLEAARENLRVGRDRYREGVLASSDLLDAETVLLRAGLEHTSARAQVRLALAQLDRALGR